MVASLVLVCEFEALLSASQRAVVAVDESGQVIGFARAITDGLSNGHLSMVAVAAQARGRGVGRALVTVVTAGPPSVTWVVRAGREGASEFFAKLGFRLSEVAMERPRA
jgi:ribosomal protein S18 acetylase RimI-like enzyme